MRKWSHIVGKAVALLVGGMVLTLGGASAAGADSQWATADRSAESSVSAPAAPTSTDSQWG